jgi:hypothetical protein
MLATINTPEVQAPSFGYFPVTSCSGYPGLLSELHEIYIQPKYNFYLIPFGNNSLFCIYYIMFYFD